jgi:outer membrane protein insertion porin family
MLVLGIAYRPAELRAQGESYQGKRIAEIRYEPDAQPLSKSYLRLIQPIAPGDPFDLTKVSEAIAKLYASGRYTDIAVDAKLRGEEVVLTFITEQSWFVGGVTAAGVPEPPNAGQLVGSTQLLLGYEFIEDDLITASRNMEAVLRNNGFFRATITPRYTFDKPTQQVNINLGIVPSARARLTDPEITGNPGRPVEKIIAATRWKRLYGLLGYQYVTENRVRTGVERVRNLYQKNDHLLARVSLEKMEYDAASNTAKPTIHVDAGPQVRIRVEGAKISKGKLRQLVPIYQERAVDRDLLVEGRRNITEYFQSDGFFDAEVEFEIEQESKNEQLIDYTINRGLRYKLVKLEVSGNHYFDARTLRERFSIQPATLLRYHNGRYSESMLQKDIGAIKYLYRSNGFTNVEVASHIDQDYRGKARDVAVSVEIDEGAQAMVSSLDIAGVNPKDLPYVQSILNSIEGQPYSQQNIATDRDTILNYFFNSGFPDSTFEYKEKPGSKPNTIDLVYTVKEGPRRFVREVIVSGLVTTNEKLVLNRISLREGDPLSQVKMTESQRRLYDLGIFAKVDMALQNPDGEERDKTVLYQLEEASRYSWSAGFGAQIARIGSSGGTNFDAPVGSTGFSPRVSLGVSRTNFLGLGHTIGIKTRFSDIQRRVTATYLAPQFEGNEKLNLTLTGVYDDSRDVRTFAAKRWESTVQLGQKRTRAVTMQYRLTYRRVSVDPNSLKITPDLIPLLSQPVQLGIVGATLIQDRRDDPIESHRGAYNTIDVGFASSALGSQSQFGRLLFRNSTYYRIGKEMVLARTTTFGILSSLRTASTPLDVPLPERFFAGGANSHRGFPDNQAGPRDLITGFPVGGKALLVSGVELRFPLIGDSLGGVLFHDAGNVYSNLGRISFRYMQKGITDFDYMVHAVGFGIRYRTPVGPIRVDFAFAPNSPRFEGFSGTEDELLHGLGVRTGQRINRFQFHFSLGQAF